MSAVAAVVRHIRTRGVASLARSVRSRGLDAAYRLAFHVRNRVRGGSPVTLQVAGLQLNLTPRGTTAFVAWSGQGHEAAELEFAASLVGPESVILDVGANAGLYALTFAGKGRALGGVPTVFAVEPCSGTFSLLLENIALNGMTGIRPLRLALSDRPGKALLHLNRPGLDGLNTLGVPVYGSVGTEVVPVETVDRVLEKEELLERVDLIKADIEGAELLMLRGAHATLSRWPDRPVIVYESNPSAARGFGYRPSEIVRLLARYGYRVTTLDGAPCDPDARDYALLLARKTRG